MSFVPTRVAIAGISQTNPAVVTTVAINYLSTGNIVRLHVPSAYGMTPLDGNLYNITVLSPTSFELPVVDSTNFPAFIAAVNQGKTAEVVPVGAGPTSVGNTPWQVTGGYQESLINDQVSNITTVNIPL